MKCMKSCFCFLSLKLGAYLIVCVFIITSITISSILSEDLIAQGSIFPSTQKTLYAILFVAHILLFFSTCCLLYGLCMEKSWPLLTFIPVAVIIAIDELAIIIYIIINKDALPDNEIASAAGQSFILVAVVFSALEIYSLYVQWQEDRAEGRELSSAI